MKKVHLIHKKSKKLLSLILVMSFVLSMLIGLPVYSSENNNDLSQTEEETDPLERFDSYEAMPEEIRPDYAEDRVIIQLAKTSQTEELELHSVYSNDYTEINEEYAQLTNSAQVNLSEEAELESFSDIQISYAEPIEEIKSELDLDIEFTEMRLLNPSEERTSNGLYSVTQTQNDTFVLELDDGLSVRDALEELNDNPQIEIAEPDYQYEFFKTPNDPMYSSQYTYNLITAPSAWDRETGGEEVVVGIIDSGIEGTHPDLEDNLWINPNPNQNGYVNDIHGYNFFEGVGGTPTDAIGHGTHVAGIIGAQGNNGIGVCGVNWDVSLAWFTVSSDQSGAYTSLVVQALNYCNLHGIKITNNSYGGGAQSDIFENAINNYNGLFIAAAGNDGRDIDENPIYPACYDCNNIISVASINSSRNLASTSNYGVENVDVAAPGVNILSTYLNGTYEERSGTSMAAPCVTGLAALLMAKYPSYTPLQIKALLCGTTAKESQLNTKLKYGGIIDAEMAVYQIGSPLTVTFSTPSGNFQDYVVSGDKVSEPDYPERSGYIFTGWYLNGSTEPFDFENTAVTQNITLTAGWTAVQSNMYGAVFPDMNFCSKVLQTVNSKDSGSRTFTSVVSDADIALMNSITSLTVNNCGIKSLTGIEYFPNLTYLSCNHNKIENLPISSLSKLRNLYCSANKITSLNINNNPDLTYFECKGNKLTSLNISGCSQLRTLYCHDNFLSNLSISGATRLTTLRCEYNRLTSLDVSGYTNLSTLNCSFNNLASLNVNGLTKLSTLYCYNNHLTSLAVGGCTNLSTLNCSFNNLTSLNVNGLTKLGTVYCYNNHLASLDVGGCTSLSTLNCEFNNLTSLNAGGLSGLKYLYCNDNNLSSLTLTGLTSLEELACNNNTLQSLDLSGLSAVTSINCGNNLLTGLTVSDKSSLTKLDCGNNRLTVLTISGLPALTDLRCGNNLLTSIDVNSFAELQTLYCNNNNLKRLELDGLSKFATLDCSANQLVELNLGVLPLLGIVFCQHNKITNINMDYLIWKADLRYNNMPSESRVVGGITDSIDFYPQNTWDNPFTDVASSASYYYDVEYVYTNNLMGGTSASTFEPATLIKRSQVATILYRAAGKPSTSGMTNPFTDVPNNGSESTNAIKWAYNKGIVNGTSSTLFEPNGYIKRQDIAVIITRYADNIAHITLPVKRTYNDTSTFTDHNDISTYAQPSVKRLYEAEIMDGKPNNIFAPNEYTSRAQTATILYRFLIMTE